MRKILPLLLVFAVAVRLRGSSRTRAIVVFPFENKSSRQDLGWISEGLREMLSSRLSGPSRYVLGHEELTAACEQLGVSSATPISLASEYKVAETLAVDWAVVGNFSVSGNRLTARARLLDVRTRKLSPSLEATGELADLVELENQLAMRLLATHDPEFTVGKIEDFRHRFPEVRLDAFENFVRGLLATDADSRIHYLTEADRRDPADHRAAFELGRFYFQQKDYGKSAEWLRKLDERDENYLESLFLLGVGEFFLGHLLAAEQAFTALAKKVPLSEVANNLGVMEARKGQYDGALENFQRAHLGDPTDADYFFNQAASQWYLKDYEAAARLLEETLRLDRDDPEAHALLADVMGKLGDEPARQKELDWLAAREGTPAPAEGDFAPQPRLKKDYDGRAFRLLSLAVQNELEGTLSALSPGEHAQAHLEKGRRLLAEGRRAEAERELVEAVTLLPQESETHVALAQVYEAEGRHQEAAGELEDALMLKNSAEAHLWLARAEAAMGRWDAARDHAQAALSLDPGNHDAAALMEEVRSHSPATKRRP